MPTNPSEYNIPTSLERRIDTTEFSGIEQDPQEQERDPLTMSAMGAATRTADHLAYMNGQPAPEKAEQLTPQQEVLAFARQVVALRYDLLDRTLLADNPHRPSYLIDSNQDDFTLGA